MNNEKLKRVGDNIYYNVSIPHDDNASIGGSPTPARFHTVRSTPLFYDAPENYTMSIIRFTVPSTFIPIQIFPIQNGQTDINLSTYSVSASYLGVTYQQYLIWTPQSSTTPPPIQPVSRKMQTQYYIYYSMWSYNHFCDLINTAFSALTTTLAIAGAPVNTASPPFITYDGTTQLFTLYIDSNFLSSGPISLFMNSALFGNFDESFNVVFNPFGSPDGADVRFVLNDILINQVALPTVAPTTTYYKYTQEFNTIGQMQSFTSLVMTSTSLPIRSEWITTQVIRGDTATNDPLQEGSLPIIADFEVDLTVGNDIRSYIFYVPSAEYKRITMTGKAPITTIDINVFWKDNYDALYPIMIPAHEIITIKIIFEKKVF